MDVQITTTLIAALSALGAVGAALAAIWQTNTMRQQNSAQLERISKAQERENMISEVRNRILINGMWNEFNRMIINGDEWLRDHIGKNNFSQLNASLIKRIYIQFHTLNLLEIVWVLKVKKEISDVVADQMIYDQAVILKNDSEATKHALSGRGYSREFVQTIWPMVFPDENVPWAE